MTEGTRKFFSPKAAATHAGCGRTTIMRALSSGDLPAIRDNKNAWRIAESDLDAWSGQRPVPDQTPTENTPGHVAATVTDTPETLARLAVAEARLADALAERDRWQALALRLSEPRPLVPAVSFWDRLFRR